MNRADDAPAEFAPQVVDIRVDGARPIDTVEYLSEQLAATENLPRGAHQDAEQRRLTLGQFDRIAAEGAPADDACDPIQDQPTGAQRRAAVGRRSNARTLARSSGISNGLTR